MNTTANVVVDYGNKTCEFIRSHINKSVTVADQEAAWRREQCARTDGVKNAAYQCCQDVYTKDKRCKADFPDGIGTFFRHCLDIWADQGLVCATVGTPLQGRDCEHAFFQMSLDAIKPTLGHVRGNLRWVCRGLNSTNRDKDKTYEAEDDPTSAWEINEHSPYFGVTVEFIKAKIESAKSSGWTRA